MALYPRMSADRRPCRLPLLGSVGTRNQMFQNLAFDIISGKNSLSIILVRSFAERYEHYLLDYRSVYHNRTGPIDRNWFIFQLIAHQLLRSWHDVNNEDPSLATLDGDLVGYPFTICKGHASDNFHFFKWFKSWCCNFDSTKSCRSSLFSKSLRECKSSGLPDYQPTLLPTGRTVDPGNIRSSQYNLVVGANFLMSAVLLEQTPDHSKSFLNDSDTWTILPPRRSPKGGPPFWQSRNYESFSPTRVS